jgi:uncharacterized membrane protein
MDNAVVLFLLRAIHVVGGVLWVGGIVLVSLFVLPAVQTLGPAAQPVMQFIMGKRKLPVYFMGLGIVTTLAGVLLMMRNITLTGGVWARSPMGRGISAGAAAAILALIVGMAVSAPTARRLTPGAAPLTEEQRAALTRRLALASKTTLVLLSISALFMATARYF